MIYDFSKLVKIGSKILYKNNGLVVQMKNGDTPVPPEPTDPIEEYQVTGLTVEYSGGSSDSEAYDVSWDPCEKDWFGETCKYEVLVKQGETLIDSVEISYDSEVAQFDPYSYIDDTEYTFEVRVVKGTKKSLPDTVSETYRDPFHDVTINIDSSELDIPDEGDTNGYTLTWENVYSADKYEVYLDGELYKTTTSSSISISDKDPNFYNLEIKAYNHKNTMISEETTLTLYDPMSSVTLSLDSSDITYNSDDTISISNLTASYGNYSSLPKYIENRLNNDSLEIFIDGDKVYTGEWNLTVSDINVSNLEKGEHELSFTLTTTYGSDATSSAVEFNVDRCGLIGNSISVTASCDSYENGVTVDVSFNESISESDTLSFTINGQSVYDFCSSGGSLTIYPDDYETYSIYPDSDNTITVEVSCETGDHSSEPLTGETSVYVPEAPEEEY